VIVTGKITVATWGGLAALVSRIALYYAGVVEMGLKNRLAIWKG